MTRASRCPPPSSAKSLTTCTRVLGRVLRSVCPPQLVRICNRALWLNCVAAAFTKPPFRISEEGWGEFDMQIEFTADKAHFIGHDLNFAKERYESKHVLVS